MRNGRGAEEEGARFGRARLRGMHAGLPILDRDNQRSGVVVRPAQPPADRVEPADGAFAPRVQRVRVWPRRRLRDPQAVMSWASRKYLQHASHRDLESLAAVFVDLIA